MLKADEKDVDVAALVKKFFSDASRRGIAAARARGDRGPGRPPAPIDPVEFNRLLHLGPMALATVFKVSRATVYRILKKGVFETTPASSPREARESP